jgi:hypothetical protein
MARSQKLFDAAAEENRNKRFYFGDPIELGMLDPIELVHEGDGRTRLARESLDVRFSLDRDL